MPDVGVEVRRRRTQETTRPPNVGGGRPTEDGDDGEREQDGVEVGFHDTAVEVDALGDATDEAEAPHDLTWVNGRKKTSLDFFSPKVASPKAS